MNHAPDVGLITWPVDQQSRVLPLCYGCPTLAFHEMNFSMNHAPGALQTRLLTTTTWNEWCFRPRSCTCKSTLGQEQPEFSFCSSPRPECCIMWGIEGRSLWRIDKTYIRLMEPSAMPMIRGVQQSIGLLMYRYNVAHLSSFSLYMAQCTHNREFLWMNKWINEWRRELMNEWMNEVF